MKRKNEKTVHFEGAMKDKFRMTKAQFDKAAGKAKKPTKKKG